MKALARRLVLVAALLATLYALAVSVSAYRGDLRVGRLARTGDDLSAAEYRAGARECLRRNEAATDALVPLATELGRKGDVAGTRELVDAALSRHRPFEALLLDAALASERRGPGGAAESLPAFEELRSLAPASRPVAQYLLGLAASLPDDARAERVAREIDVSWPGSFDALVALSDVASRHGDEAEARRLFLAALDAAPRTAEEAAARPRPAIFDVEERRRALVASRGALPGDDSGAAPVKGPRP